MDMWLLNDAADWFREKRRIRYDSGTKFYDSDGFVTLIFPNHSEAWKKIMRV